MARYRHPRLRRRMRWTAPIVIVCGVAYVVAALMAPRTGLLWWIPWVFLGAQLIALGLWFTDVVRVRRRVISIDGRCCGSCLFNLKGLPAQGTCPECGHEYQIGDTIAKWKHDLGFNGRYEYRHWPSLGQLESESRDTDAGR